MEQQQSAGAAEQPPLKPDIKKLRIEEAIKRNRRKKLLLALYIALGIGAIVALSVWWARRPVPPTPGAIYEDQKQEHVPLEEKHTYNSNPPSSGPHFGSPANWGIYDYEVNDKIFIHNLEHGGIWIAYRPSIGADAAGELKAIIDSYGGSKFVMAPRAANDADIAIAAWTHVYKFDLSGGHLSQQQKTDIITFYKKLKNHGPEDVPDFMAGIDPKTAK